MQVSTFRQCNLTFTLPCLKLTTVLTFPNRFWQLNAARVNFAILNTILACSKCSIYMLKHLDL